MMYATVVHQLGAVQCMELERVVQVNRLRVVKGEPAWLVVGLHKGMEEAVADAREVKRLLKGECGMLNENPSAGNHVGEVIDNGGKGEVGSGKGEA